jgi:hypothetical protein
LVSLGLLALDRTCRRTFMIASAILESLVDSMFPENR